MKVVKRCLCWKTRDQRMNTMLTHITSWFFTINCSYVLNNRHIHFSAFRQRATRHTICGSYCFSALQQPCKTNKVSWFLTFKSIHNIQPVSDMGKSYYNCTVKLKLTARHKCAYIYSWNLLGLHQWPQNGLHSPLWVILCVHIFHALPNWWCWENLDYSQRYAVKM